jgi:hypothetical protein
MKEALKAIEAALTDAREARDRAQVRLADAQAAVDRLEAAKAVLRGEPVAGAERGKTERDQVAQGRSKRLSAHARPRGGSPRARKNGGPTTSQAAATLMEEAMRKVGNGGMTEHQLAEAIGLVGRGAHMKRQAALRSLVAANVFVVANESSSDGSPLYTLSARAAGAVAGGPAEVV